MRQLPDVPEGMRLFIWVARVATGNIATPIVARDYAQAEEAAVLQRVVWGCDRRNAETLVDDPDQIIEVTDMGESIIATCETPDRCEWCDDRGPVWDGLCGDCYKIRRNA